MKIGILGTGVVGQTIGTKLVSLGHDVKMGARVAGNEKAEKWVKENGARATHGTFTDAAVWLRLWGTFKTPNINFHIARP